MAPVYRLARQGTTLKCGATPAAPILRGTRGDRGRSVRSCGESSPALRIGCPGCSCHPEPVEGSNSQVPKAHIALLLLRNNSGTRATRRRDMGVLPMGGLFVPRESRIQGRHGPATYARDECATRGMLIADDSSRVTRRFGGSTYLPPSFLVRTHGSRTLQAAEVNVNHPRSNDVAPLVYGRGWLNPPLIHSRNDGNLTRMLMLACDGEVDGVERVVVNGVVASGHAIVSLPAGSS